MIKPVKSYRMKKYLLLAFILISACGLASAQDRCDKSKEEMFREVKEFKMKFLAQELKLSDEQCRTFFDLYSAQMDERHRLWEPAVELERKVKNDPNASEADYNAVSEAISKAKSGEVEIEERYDGKFRKILTSKQVYELKDAENRFREKMREMRSKHPKHKKK